MSIADRVAVFTGGYFDSDTLTFTDVYTAGWFNEDAPPTPVADPEEEEIIVFKPNKKNNGKVDGHAVTATAVSSRYSFANRRAASPDRLVILVQNTHATAKVRVDLGDDAVVANGDSIYLGPGKEKVLIPGLSDTDIAFVSDVNAEVIYTLGSQVAG